MRTKHCGGLMAVASVVALASCGDETPPMDDTPRVDTTSLNTAPVCVPTGAGQQVVAVSDDGSFLAYLACDEDGASVKSRTLDEAPGESSSAATPATSVGFLLDNEHVFYGADGEWFVRRADGSAGATPLATLSTSAIEQVRPFLQRVSNTEFAPRLLVLERDGGQGKISLRAVDDGYQSAETLLESDEVRGDLSLLSASGRTLLVEREAASYLRLRTNDATKTLELPFGPTELTMAPIGLGDTHNFAFTEDALVRVELETGERVVLADREALTDETGLIEREDAPGVKYAHFIADGNPSRRIRDASEPLETLAEANASHQALSLDNETIVFASDGKLWAVSARGGSAPVELIADAGAVSELVVAFPLNGSEVAFRDADGRLHRAPIDGSGPATLLDDGVALADSIGYNAVGTRLIWISSGPGPADTLRSVAAGSSSEESETLSDDVSAWWPIPGSADVLYLTAGEIKPVTP